MTDRRTDGQAHDASIASRGKKQADRSNKFVEQYVFECAIHFAFDVRTLQKNYEQHFSLFVLLKLGMILTLI